MPKIGKRSIRVKHDLTDEFIEFNIMYNSKLGFYVEIPEKWHEAFDTETGEKLNEFHAQTYKKSHHSTKQRVVTASTEDEAEQNLQAVIKHLMTANVTRREVIVIFYHGETAGRYSSEDRNDEHKDVGVKLGLLYCTETRSGAAEPKYYKFKPNYFDKDKMDRSQCHVGRSPVAIDDTPENRQALETIYKALTVLEDNLRSFTKDPESVMNLITFNQKLIG